MTTCSKFLSTPGRENVCQNCWQIKEKHDSACISSTANEFNGLDADPHYWSVQCVMKWLETIGLKKYCSAFELNQITGQVLFTLSSKSVLLMNLINDIDDREIFSTLLEELQSIVPSTPGATVPAPLRITVPQQSDRVLRRYSSIMVPQIFDETQLADCKEHLHNYFAIADTSEDEHLDSVEFRAFLHQLHIAILSNTEIEEIRADIPSADKTRATFEEVYKYIRSIIIMEEDFSQPKFRLFQAMLSADLQHQCALGGITQFLNQTWSAFGHFKRGGASGQLVMDANDAVNVLLQGSYSLVDLVRWPDHLTESIEPKHAVIKGIVWKHKSKLSPDARAGEIIFPSEFDGCLPIDIASAQHLKYYGCSLANETQMKVSLVQKHEIIDFHYGENYFDDFVMKLNGAGIERHEFSHLDCPHDDFNRSGYFIIGKIVNNNELHLTAFIVPSKHTLYIPPNTIHSNDHLRGTWRTMLALDDIDRVVLKKSTPDGKSNTAFQFTFS